MDIYIYIDGNREACLKFMELWKRKHETGQWLEVEAAEVMSSRCEFPSFSSAGIVFSGESNKQNAEVLPVNSGDRSTENGGESGMRFHFEVFVGSYLESLQLIITPLILFKISNWKRKRIFD